MVGFRLATPVRVNWEGPKCDGMSNRISRRQFLSVAVGSLIGMSGCSKVQDTVATGGGGSPTDETPAPQPTDTDSTTDTGDVMWKTFQNDVKNSGYYPSSGFSQANIVQRHKRATDTYYIPVGTAEQLFIPRSDNHLVKFALPSFQSEWTVELSQAIHRAGALSDKYVFVTGDELYAINRSTGNIEWSTSFEATFTISPTIYNGVVYAATDDGRVHAIEAHSGTQIWETVEISPDITSLLAVDSNNVYIPTSLGLSVYSRDSGSRNWTFDAGTLATAPTLFHGNVIIGEVSGAVYSLTAGGKTNWTRAIGNGVKVSPAVANGTIYVPSAGKLYALEAASGGKEWSSPVPISTPFPPIATPNVVVAGGQNHIVGFASDTGTKQWHYTTESSSLHSPAILGDQIAIGGTKTVFLLN